jgi:integrase
MAHSRPKGTSFEYIFKRAGLLPKPIYITYASREEGDKNAKVIEQLLDKGIVHPSLLAATKILTIDHLINEYLRCVNVSPKSQGVLTPLRNTIGHVRLLLITATWVDEWVTGLKRQDKLAPNTIKTKVETLARCTEWGVRAGHLTLIGSPLRNLPVGYTHYTRQDEMVAGVKKEDIERDRRLEEGELERIQAVLAAGVLPRKQRPYVLPHKIELEFLVVLALETAMRMSEMATLSLDQLDIRRVTIFLEKTKNGDKRQVPMSTVAVAKITEYLIFRAAQPWAKESTDVFPWLAECKGKTKNMSDFLSKLFIGIFASAECADLKFHDFRHEAVSRLFERTTFSDTEIMKISGHRSQKMLRRYANLRASNLASKMW